MTSNKRLGDMTEAERQAAIRRAAQKFQAELDASAGLISAIFGDGDALTYRNVNKFSSDVPETAHDGHAVAVIRPLTPSEADAEVGQMYRVRCLQDDAEFDAFAEELAAGGEGR